MGKVSPGVLAEPHEILTPQEWRQLGRDRRKVVPRSSHAEWSPPPGRPDPVAVLEEQARSRVPDLVPIRHGRMAASAFAYFRGAAAPMAWDLAQLPSSDIRVQCCGDAHLLNFGMFAAPDRQLVFDVNDFDETLPAPFEWDVKRLAASVAVAARDNGFGLRSQRIAARRCAHVYRTEMENFAQMRFLDVWYSRIDVDQVCQLLDAVQSRKAVRRRAEDVHKAYQHTSVQALEKLCHQVDGEYRIKPVPPVVVRFGIESEPTIAEELRGAIARYRETLAADRQEVLRRYYFGDFARKVVGVGSVGTEAFIFLLLGDRPDEPLFLQLKEAQESVLAPFAGAERVRPPGRAGGPRRAADAGRRRPLPGLDQRPGRGRGGAQAVLRPPATRHEGLDERPGHGPAAADLLRRAVRLGPGPGARPDRPRPDDRWIPGLQRPLRPGHRGVRGGLRGAERS